MVALDEGLAEGDAVLAEAIWRYVEIFSTFLIIIISHSLMLHLL
jgi:hypothetical protein